MNRKEDKQIKNIKVSLGLLVGYIIAGNINMFFFDKSFKDAFSDHRIIYSFAGILLAIILYKISNSNKKQNND